MSKQRHPGCSNRSLKSHLRAATLLEREIKLTYSLDAASDGVL
jgi:hypothetical protein